ncbi:rhodanese-like domain-containing protein [Nitrosopumilus maritimus]|uniref:Rhodanese domain protein n=1 Tax=Nitrosopumilus maritimus (strain SCM1) TaxID=436308 RepID=A9A1J2_NITMS|nr:rhodanese-like domain-containing protein [Nitrosopumilus maritimus]ABX13171.1 Rhodanese domain protein [Nitrosopumilus maritimus SCM1]
MNKVIPVGIGIAVIVVIAMAAGFIGYEVEPTPSAIPIDQPFSISSSELEQQMTLDPNLVVIDMRNSNSYVDGHIAGSSVDVMEGATLDKRIKTMFGRIPEVTQNMHVVLVGDSQSSALNSAQIMNDAGIKTSFLVDGIQSWDENLSTKMTPTVTSSEELYEQLQNQDDVYLLDVREPSELEVTMISGSKNIPLADIFIEENLSEIPTDKPVVIICGSGNRATIATYELAQHGIDFQVLEGGIIAWDAYLDENNLPKH